MNGNIIDNKPFEKHIPSVFVVGSPFQALCAIAAVRQLEIKEYKMIALLAKGNVRNNQVTSLFEQYNIKYVSISFINKFTNIVIKLFSLIPKKSGYHRLFIGDYRNLQEYAVGCHYVVDSSDIVCLDDGTPTISLLRNCPSLPIKYFNKKWIEMIKKTRGLNRLKNFLTIYGDITNLRYNIRTLHLYNMVDNEGTSFEQSKDIYIIGTNVDSFCVALNIPEHIYIEKLGCLMKNLQQKYSGHNICFISHGREYKDYGQQLCKQYGCIFHRPKMMVELELLKMASSPKAIFGYTSNALYTLKKLFPATRVVNILFDLPKNNSSYNDYVIISEYYEQNGVELVKEKI